MTHTVAAPEFNVWSGPVDREDGWTHRLTTSSLQEALRYVERVGVGDTGSVVYEFGEFTANGAPDEGDLACWWSANLRDAEGQPRGRGIGWSDEHQSYVSYCYPGMIAADDRATSLTIPVVSPPSGDHLRSGGM